MRADGLAASTISRRVSAVRAYFRHLVLIGARAENPAAALKLPRRGRTLPRALSPAETERLIDAATGRLPARSATARSSSSCTAPGFACREAMGLEKGSVALEERVVRVSARAARNVSSRSAGRRPRPCGGTSPSAAPTSTGVTAPSSSSTREVARSRGQARSSSSGSSPSVPGSSRTRPSAPPAALVRDAPARGRRRPPLRPGDARSRRPGHDRALHARLGPAPARCLLRRAPTRAGARRRNRTGLRNNFATEARRRSTALLYSRA